LKRREYSGSSGAKSERRLCSAFLPAPNPGDSKAKVDNNPAQQLEREPLTWAGDGNELTNAMNQFQK
jgi:hypothetical protein